MTTSNPEESNQIFTVKNKTGIHARPAASIVRTANRYTDTELWIEKDGESTSGKSIMGIMMLAAGKDSKVHCRAIGPSAEALLKDLGNLFENHFDE